MADLQTEYVGLSVKNPLIISSSGLTDQLDKILELEKQGAGAVVLKSLFEEQIRHESGLLLEGADYPEAHDYVSHYARYNNVEKYLQLIESAREKTQLPVIASINCMAASEWTDFAKRIEDAGAHALELNIYYIPLDRGKASAEYEQRYFDIAAEICKRVSIPVIMKLGQNFTNLVYLVDQLSSWDVKAVVLFNRFYSPDIHIRDFRMTAGSVLSSPSEMRESLRWVSIVSSQVPAIQISASTGIHGGEAVIKQLLAGAQVVQLCSVLYRKGVGYLCRIRDEIEDWMDKKQYKSIDEFRGRMNYSKIEDPAVFERSQFLKYYSDPE